MFFVIVVVVHLLNKRTIHAESRRRQQSRKKSIYRVVTGVNEDEVVGVDFPYHVLNFVVISSSPIERIQESIISILVR